MAHARRWRDRRLARDYFTTEGTEGERARACDKPYREPLVGDLLVTYAFDRPETFQKVRSDDDSSATCSCGGRANGKCSKERVDPAAIASSAVAHSVAMIPHVRDFVTFRSMRAQLQIRLGSVKAGANRGRGSRGQRFRAFFSAPDGGRRPRANEFAHATPGRVCVAV
jgi:hypothetical protein